MHSTKHTSRSGLVLIAVVCALAAGPAAAAAQPMESLAQELYYSSYDPAKDLRSPDTREAAAQAAPAVQDLRSPDTRDAAEGRTPDTFPAVVPQPAPVAESGFDWLDAVVGFAAALGLVLLLTAGVVLGRRRTRRHHPLAA